MHQYKTERILIWGKTYPELSTKHTETVCTAGVREDGQPIRIYPVPLRYLGNEQQYGLYQWVSVPIAKSDKDSRPESYRISSAEIRIVGEIPTDQMEWAERRKWIFRDPSWQFANVGELKAAERSTGRSLGIVAPGSIEGVVLRRKPEEERRAYERKMQAIQAQGDAFLPEYKTLEYRDHEILLKWRCNGGCPECARGPHEMQVLDWGLVELARKRGWDWAAAVDRLQALASGDYDLRLFLGNFKAHRKAFSIVGLWYPKRRAQLPLL
jgi:hypothetical protein